MSKLKIVQAVLNHFKTHWKKWCALVLCLGLAIPGYNIDTPWFSCGKTDIKLQKVGSTPDEK